MVNEVGPFVLLLEKLREEDKHKHFWVSFLMQFVFLLWLPVAISTGMTLLIGTAKECWDQCCGTGFCWYDMVANVLGIGAGVMVFTALQLLLRLAI